MKLIREWNFEFHFSFWPRAPLKFYFSFWPRTPLKVLKRSHFSYVPRLAQPPKNEIFRLTRKHRSSKQPKQIFPNVPGWAHLLTLKYHRTWFSTLFWAALRPLNLWRSKGSHSLSMKNPKLIICRHHASAAGRLFNLKFWDETHLFWVKISQSVISKLYHPCSKRNPNL